MGKIYTTIPLFLMILLSCSNITQETPSFRTGLVNFVSGNVLISGPSGKERAALIGDPVTAEMRVRTIGEKSFCEIYFDDTAVKISGNSSFLADTVLYREGLSQETALHLSKGELFIKAEKLSKGSSLSAKTSTTVAAVRGTEFFISAAALTTVSCLSGKVEIAALIKNNGSSVFISSDEETKTAQGTVTKNSISPSRSRILAEKASIAPLSSENAGTFEKIRSGDKETIARLQRQIAAFFTHTSWRTAKPDEIQQTAANSPSAEKKTFEPDGKQAPQTEALPEKTVIAVGKNILTETEQPVKINAPGLPAAKSEPVLHKNTTMTKTTDTSAGKIIAARQTRSADKAMPSAPELLSVKTAPVRSAEKAIPSYTEKPAALKTQTVSPVRKSAAAAEETAEADAPAPKKKAAAAETASPQNVHQPQKTAAGATVPPYGSDLFILQ